MPEEENKKLRDLVSETLQTKGVLGRIQAEIRASVFLALEEQDVFKDKSPFINKQLKDYLRSPDGIIVISLVREFLEFFNLEFASMVFDPETHSGLDYTYEGRSKLASTLNISDNDKRQPLLGHIFKHSKLFLSRVEKDDPLTNDVSHPVTKLMDEDLLPSNNQLLNEEPIAEPTTTKGEDKFPNQSFSGINRSFTDFNHKVEERLNEKINKESLVSTAASLSSLSNLPPLGKSCQQDLKDKKEHYDLKALLDIASDKNYEEDFASSESSHLKKGSKAETASEESEIEEDISGLSNLSGQQDDNTADVSISKASGHGDYLENI